MLCRELVFCQYGLAYQVEKSGAAAPPCANTMDQVHGVPQLSLTRDVVGAGKPDD
jgi:hypothetical protein